MATGADWRVGDAEREAVAEQLREHYAAGRLTIDEFRARRSGAWLEAVPVAVGMPWLARVIWLARAALVGRAFWRAGERASRPLRARREYRRHPGHGSALYQRHPGTEWHQARVGDLSG